MTLVSALLLSAALQAPPACPAAVRELRVQTQAGHVLAARLAMPAGARRAPVVVMVSGAGPEDRDYSTVNSPQFDNHFFALVEERLRCAGIGALRFDEVGTGRSTGSYAEYATTRTLADDVRTLVDALRREPGIDSTGIAILGHSEGGVIAAMVAVERPDVAAVLLLAAPVERGADIVRFQLAMEEHTGADAAEAARREHARRSASDRWYRFFLDFSPAPFYARLRQPVLILHGEYDFQVPASQADSILTLARSGGVRAGYCRRYPKYGHGFYTDVPEFATASPEVLDDIARFARQVLVARRAPVLPGGPCRREGGGALRASAGAARQATTAP